MVMTAPGSAAVGPVILVGTVVPLKMEKVNVCVALSVGAVQFAGVWKVTELGVKVQVPPEREASKAAANQVEGGWRDVCDEPATC